MVLKLYDLYSDIFLLFGINIFDSVFTCFSDCGFLELQYKNILTNVTIHRRNSFKFGSVNLITKVMLMFSVCVKVGGILIVFKCPEWVGVQSVCLCLERVIGAWNNDDIYA